MEFDFDHWKTLYETDPDQFERERQKALSGAVKELTEDEIKQQRLLGSVNRQDMELVKIKSPIERFNRVQTGFWKQFLHFKEALDGNIIQPERKEGTILEFKPKQ